MRHVFPFLMALAVVACGGPSVPEPAPAQQTIRAVFASRPSVLTDFSNSLLERIETGSHPPVTIERLNSAGSLIVLSALQSGRGDIGFSLSDVAYLAYRKGLETEPFPHTGIRSVAVRWMSTMYVLVPRTSPYHRLADLAKHHIGTVPLGSADEVLTKLLLDAHGIPASDVVLAPMSLDSLLEQMHHGTIDAAMYPGTPLDDMRTLIAEHDLRVVELDTGVVGQLQEKYPFIKSVSIESGLVSTKGPLTVGVDSVLLCRADLDEKLVYHITSAFYGLLLATAQKSAGVDPNNAAAVPIPLHPGAARFYREQQVLNGL